MLCGLAKHFNTGDVRLLTLRGIKPSQQKLNFVSKLVSKIANTYVIVRERNKKTEGYHFHALLKVSTPPKPSWFKKGVHMHIARIGHCPLRVDFPTNQEFHDFKELAPDASAAMEEKQVSNLIYKAQSRNTDVLKVLKYISKELEMPIQYHDYQIVVSKKNQTIL